MPASDVKRVFESISAKRKAYSDLFNYYDGDQPVMYSTVAMREVFRNLDARFTLNFCAVVVDAVKERVSFKGFSAAAKAVEKTLNDLVHSQDWINEADETHEAAFVCGESFVIVWPQLDALGQETGQADIFYNDPRNVAIFYDPSNPKVARFAGKMWCDDEDFHHMTLYYRDHLEYYVTSKASTVAADVSATSFTPDLTRTGVVVNGNQISWPDNPYAPELPVFHFQLEKRVVKSDIKNVVPLQNGMNKLMADMMITSEFSAWPQRWVISNSDTQALQVKPGTILALPGGQSGEQDTEAGEFKSADLDVYLNAVDKMIGYISSITNTPKHYFEPSTDAPSGEALLAMEAPLNKKAQDRIDKFSPVWQRVAAFALRVMGMTVDAQQISVIFLQPETIQPKTQWEINTLKAPFLPSDTILAESGYTLAQIQEINAKLAKEKSEQNNQLANVYSQAMANFNRAPVDNNALPEVLANAAI